MLPAPPLWGSHGCGGPADRPGWAHDLADPPCSPDGRRASATHGAALTFETLVEGQATHARLRMHDDTLLRVVAGIVR